MVYVRYKQAALLEKSSILDKFCVTSQCHRKHTIRILRGFKRFTTPEARKRAKPSLYQDEALLVPLKTIWRSPTTPYPRTKESNHVSNKVKQKLAK